MTTVHAPCPNLATTRIPTTTPDRMAALRLITSLRFQPRLRCLRWYLVIPAPAMVKPVNTPMA